MFNRPVKQQILIAINCGFHWVERKRMTGSHGQETCYCRIEHWVALLNKTKDLLFQLGNHNLLQPDDYNHIVAECLVMLGDRDKMVTMEETVSTYLKLKKAQLCILPSTSHSIEQVDTSLLAFHLRRFLG